MKRFSNILLFADAGTDQSAALKRAVTLAKNNQASLTLVDVVDSVPDELQMAITVVTLQELCDIAVAEKREQLQQIIRTIADAEIAVDYVDPQLHLIEGDAKQIVPTIARDLDVDLIVMGTVARTGIAGFFMGNTAESILTRLDCSVLTVKPPGFICPVTLEA